MFKGHLTSKQISVYRRVNLNVNLLVNASCQCSKKKKKKKSTKKTKHFCIWVVLFSSFFGDAE